VKADSHAEARSGVKSEAVGALVHETVHVVQQYDQARGGNRAPVWLTEGIADYIRCWKYEPAENRHPISPVKDNGQRASYTDSYQTTAAFLWYVTGKYDHELVVELNQAARDGRYTADLWKKYAGKPIEELWTEFAATLKK
jgi:hypothetical protein